MKQLARFSISVRDEDFVLHLEDAAGEKLDFAVTLDQLDAVIDALDEMLAENEARYFDIATESPSLQRLA